MEPFQVETGRLVDSRTQRASNRYTEADALVNMDERLWSVIELAAVMVRKSYNGISLKPEGNEPIPTNTSNAEENAILEAKKFADQIDIPSLLYNYTKDLWKYGHKFIQPLKNRPLKILHFRLSLHNVFYSDIIIKAEIYAMW